MPLRCSLWKTASVPLVFGIRKESQSVSTTDLKLGDHKPPTGYLGTLSEVLRVQNAIVFPFRIQRFPFEYRSGRLCSIHSRHLCSRLTLLPICPVDSRHRSVVKRASAACPFVDLMIVFLVLAKGVCQFLENRLRTRRTTSHSMDV